MDPSTQPSCTESLFFTPGERRLRSGFRLLGQLILLAVFAFCILGALAAIFYFNTELPGFAYSLLPQAASIFAITLSVFLARRWLDRRTFVSLGLSLDARAGWDLLVGFGIAGLMMTLIFLIEWSVGWLTFQGFVGHGASLLPVAAGVFLLFMAVSWGEELLYRGYWLQNLEEGTNLFWGVLLSSLVFALGHLANPNASLTAIVGLVASGIFLAYGYTSTRQLWLPMGLHTGWNFFEGTVFGFPVSGLGDFPRIIDQAVNGPARITGGLFGPEAGLVLLPALLLGVGLVYLYTRRRPKPGISPTGVNIP